jgi:signal transduction histidine kinase
MRWAPQSLFARLLAALLAVIGVTLTVIIVLIMQDRRDLALRVGGAWNTSHRITEITNSVASLQGTQRASEIARLKEKPVVVSGQIDVRVLRRRLDTVNIAERFEYQLRRQLGPGYQVTVTPAHLENRDVVRMITSALPRTAEMIVNGVAAPPRFTPALPPMNVHSNRETATVRDPASGSGPPAPGAPGAAIAYEPAFNATFVQGEDGSAAGVVRVETLPGVPPADAIFGIGPMPPGEGPPEAGRSVHIIGTGPPPALMQGARRVVFPGLLDVNVRLPDGGALTFRVAPPWPEPPLPVRIFLELGILTLALGLALYLTTRSITRPLSDLAHAADAVGRSVRHPRLIEKGAREIRDATRAFNAMQDRLRRYLDSRTRVLAAMSHDLKTPLTRLRLRVESVSDAGLRERFSTDLDEMESLVHSALGLFKGLDDDEVFEPIELDGLLQTLRAQFAELGHDITIEGHARGPISVKPRALKRCLTNLLDNAIKFGSKATLVVEDGQALVIRVRDDGPGIPPAALEQVFEPFFRLESSRSRDTGGTGLGLTIARDVAQAHGGTLVLHNLSEHGPPERGLEAVLTLPRNSSRR